MAELSTFKKIVAILPLFLFDIILPTVDIGTDAVLISKLYATDYVCKDTYYENCNNKDLVDDEYYCQNRDICQLENGTYSCNHTGTYKICLEDPKVFCTTTPNLNYYRKEYEYVFCNCVFHPIYASSLLFIFLLNYIVSWIDYLGKAHWSL